MEISWQMLTGKGDPCDHVHPRRVNASTRRRSGSSAEHFHFKDTNKQHCKDALRDLKLFQKVMIVTFRTSRKDHSNLTVEASLGHIHANQMAASTVTTMIARANAYAWTAPESL